MADLRVKLSRITTKKVPALTLIVVGLVGMVLGVFAASITVTTSNFNGEIGTFHNNNGNVAITDKGLSVVANSTVITNNSTATLGAGTNKNLYSGSAFTAGHWMDTLTISDSVDSSVHTVTIKISSGATAPNSSTPLAGGTVTLTITAATNNGTVTAYIDLGSSSVTAPITVYASST